MSTPFEISDQMTEEFCDLSPIAATNYGVSGRDHLWDDLSPEGHAAKARFYKARIDDLAPHFGHPERKQAVAARVLTADLQESLRRYENGEHLIDLNHIYSPVQRIRDVFDLMEHETDDGWSAIVTRLATIHEPLSGYRQCLQAGLDAGELVAKRQVESVIDQCRLLSSEGSRFSKYQGLAGDRDTE